MSNDDFLDGLRSQWQERVVDLGDVAARVEAGEVRIRSERRKRLLQILLLGAFCLYFFWQAWVLDDVLFHLGGVAFLTAVALGLADYVYLRRNAGSAYLADPRSVLANAERQARIAVRLAEGLLAHSVLLGVCAAIVFVFVLVFQLYPPAVLLIGAIWVAAAIGVFLAYHAKRTAARGELERIHALQAELEGEG